MALEPTVNSFEKALETLYQIRDMSEAGEKLIRRGNAAGARCCFRSMDVLCEELQQFLTYCDKSVTKVTAVPSKIVIKVKRPSRKNKNAIGRGPGRPKKWA